MEWAISHTEIASPLRATALTIFPARVRYLMSFHADTRLQAGSQAARLLMSTLLVSVCVSASALLLSSCAKPKEAPANTEVLQRRYPLKGVIISIDAAHQSLMVKHEAIPGYMPAMTMEFQVSAGDLANAREGRRIRGELVPDDGGDLRLEKIWPDDAVSRDVLAASARSLREDTANRGKGAYREVGEVIPEFALTNQDGELVSATRYRRRQIMLNFIYSRCPIPNMCPLATSKMVQTQKLAREAGVKDLEFISITLDPGFDTPGVLKEYARARGIDTSNFSLLTGPEAALNDLLTQFGVIAQLEGGLIRHTLATLLIDDKGRIIHRADGSLWEPQDFVAKMKR